MKKNVVLMFSLVFAFISINSIAQLTLPAVGEGYYHIKDGHPNMGDNKVNKYVNYKGFTFIGAPSEESVLSFKFNPILKRKIWVSEKGTARTLPNFLELSINKRITKQELLSSYMLSKNTNKALVEQKITQLTKAYKSKSYVEKKLLVKKFYTGVARKTITNKAIDSLINWLDNTPDTILIKINAGISSPGYWKIGKDGILKAEPVDGYLPYIKEAIFFSSFSPTGKNLKYRSEFNSNGIPLKKMGDGIIVEKLLQKYLCDFEVVCSAFSYLTPPIEFAKTLGCNNYKLILTKNDIYFELF